MNAYGVIPNCLGYFVLNNANANNTTITALRQLYGFNPLHCRLRCIPYTINLLSQVIIFGNDKDAYDNALEEYGSKERLIGEWRKHSPLSVLVDVINYIKILQQHELFAEF